MQKLFENWRKYRKKVLKEYVPDTDLIHKAENPLSSMKVSDEERNLLLNQFRIILSYGIPPLAIPELKQAIGVLDKNPSLSNTGYAALALLATIPFLGAPVKGLGQAGKVVSQANKVKTAKQIVNSAEKTSKAMKGAPQYQELASKIDDAVVKAKEEIEALIPWAIGRRAYLFAYGQAGRAIQNMKLLINAAKKLGTVWTKIAWRGESYKHIDDLFIRLGLPLKGEEYLKLKKIFEESVKSGSEGVWIPLKTKPFTLTSASIDHVSQHGTRLGRIEAEAAEAGIQSFSKSKKIAEEFAVADIPHPNGVKVLYKVQGQTLVDVEKTIERGTDFLKSGPTEKTGMTANEIREFLQEEEELLSHGAVEIQEIFIKFFFN